jgi:hypothetical protein
MLGSVDGVAIDRQPNPFTRQRLVHVHLQVSRELYAMTAWKESPSAESAQIALIPLLDCSHKLRPDRLAASSARFTAGHDLPAISSSVAFNLTS